MEENEEKYSYMWDKFSGKIFHFIGEHFWLLLIGAVLFLIDLRIGAFYSFFILFFLDVLNDDSSVFYRGVEVSRHREISSKIDIIAHKLKVNSKDIEDYFEIKTEEYTKEAKDELATDLGKFKTTLRKMNKE